ncbi:MAG: hypothetical protein K2I63_00325, partial [Helicobacter sp.]|nr:hypothetical protein [Helicobacter sp.]
YLQEIYTRNGDEQVLHKIASIYYLFLKDQQKAISLYRAHIKKYGITPLIGENLALIYLQMKAYRQAGQIYEELYQETLNELYAKNALDIYFQANQANMDLAQRFLEKNPLIDLRDQMLLEIYSQKKDYKRAIETLQRLYEQTNDVGFLGFKAIMSYESTKNPSDEKLIQSVIKDLKEVVKEIDDALYWNYLGYLMIDHDINISEGMEYVKKALLKDPSNAYYLDSLAWGYYKLGDCKNAQLTIQEIPLEMVEKEKEIRGHFDVITQCVFKEGRL